MHYVFHSGFENFDFSDMVDESVEHEDMFPSPLRGIPVSCGLKLGDDKPVPLIYFGRETKASGRAAPASPEPIPLPSQSFSSSRPGSNNPLNSIIRKWEATFARHGGFMESGDFVSSNGKNDGRYYEADEWLDDGDVDDNGDDDEYYDVVLDLFKSIDTSNDANVPERAEEGDDGSVEEEYETDEEGGDNDEMDSTGGSWEVLIRRLEASKQPVVKEVVTELEQVQAFPGHSKQKKQKSLKDLTARLRRLLPKINQIQSQWQAAIWELVSTANPLVTMQSFIDLWNEISASKQREEIVKERIDLIAKLRNEPLTDIVSSWKSGEVFTRQKHDSFFNVITKIWDLWNIEEECSGRVVAASLAAPDKPLSRIEKRFGSHLCEQLSDHHQQQVPGSLEAAATTTTLNEFGLTPDIGAIFLRIALFGSKKSKIDNSENDFTVVSLPATVYIYRKNELLKCKLMEIKSLTTQMIQVIDKEWESNGENNEQVHTEFNSFNDLFESYQQKYVRKQDRVRLVTCVDGWKLFAVKTNSGEYVNLYDIASKATAAGYYGFTDKSGNPMFMSQISSLRSADLEVKKKEQEVTDEKKRKRTDAQEKLKIISPPNEPPFGDTFVPFPDFSKDLFKIATKPPPPTAPVTATPTNQAMIVD